MPEWLFKKQLIAATGVELTRMWKALSAKEKEVYEERAKAEVAKIQKEAQLAAKKQAGGEGGYAKLREQIENFASKQPEGFLQLYDQLAANDTVFTNRLQRQAEKEKQKADKEAEAARKARYPIADHLLKDEPPVDLAEWPSPRHGLNLPPELKPAWAQY